MFSLICFVMFIGSFFCVGAAPLGAAEPPAPQAVNVGYLENIALESPVAGKERITITVSRLSGATVESQPGNALLVKLDNMFVPLDLRTPRGEGALRNVLRVLPAQKILEGKQWAYLTIDLKERVPHSVRQEGPNILIDFNVAALKEPAADAAPKPPATTEATNVPITPKDVAPKDVVPKDKAVGGEQTPESKNYAGHQISIDFQDANIKSVFRLLAELAGVSIVSGDDVKGNVTIQMKNVPWDQALDTILSITGLGKRQAGNVITVMTLDKIKKDDADRQAVQTRPSSEPLITRVVNVDYTDAKKLTENLLDLLPKDKDGKVQGSVKVDEHSNSLIIQATRQDMTRLFPIIEKIDKPTAQILIKANIVETTKDTARNLGIQWGGMWGQKIGNQGLYVNPGGTGGLATSPGSAFAGTYTPTSGTTGIAGQGFGVNFPATMSSTASASLGLMFGTIGENILDLQLNALQKDGKLNILSSPSITTLDNQKAFTENGEKIPFVTMDTSGGTVTKSVKFENAVLRLEITPHVIDGKNLKMKILVQKDEVDPSRNVDGNPYIIKKQTETNLIVQDGETIVISGLTKQKNIDNVNGVPWLKDIPLLGWLFKGEGKSESMEEVLIFITPNIMKPQEVAGIQTGP
ncbi:MAG: type IV pilus secretin PilQ [Deltaproteobacteria bacterium]|nr:type IV pilus secretin PilQ [Deltaproteobacteria bacterium]